MSDIDDIKDRIDAVELIGETVKLRRSGKNYSGFCPFHPNTRTPAFVVFPESGTWRCFGACNEGGDVFKFLMKKEGWEFPEALRYLAGRAGVQLRPQSAQEGEAEEAHSRLRELLETAVTFYRHHLRNSDSGTQVLQYLHTRGLNDTALETFEVGYAPPSSGMTREFLTSRGYAEEELAQAGMTSEREGGGNRDRFRNRIMFPIRDAKGRMAGFGARVVDPNDVPKFLNSPQTPIFDKGKLLYGLDKARKAIRREEHAVIVEGYLDVIALHQAQNENAVSPMGTALSEHQLRLLRRYARRMVLALDADAAGNQATLRGLTIARAALDRQSDPVFDARGLVRYEGRLDADIRVLTLPPGTDPDEVVTQDASAWTALVSGARPIVSYVVDVLLSGQDVEDPKVKADVARQVMPLIEDVTDAVEREAYRQALARRLRVDERALAGWSPRPPRRARGARSALPTAAEGETIVGARGREVVAMERFCLGLLLQDPELLYRVDRELQSLGLERLSAQDFTGTESQVIFQAVRSALAQDEDEPTNHWRAALQSPWAEVAEAARSESSELVTNVKQGAGRPRLDDEIAARFLQLRKRNLDFSLSRLRFQLEAVQAGSEGEGGETLGIGDLTRQVGGLASQKARLERALAKRQGTLRQSLLESGW